LIGREDDDRSAHALASFDRLDELSDLTVHVGDGAVVQRQEPVEILGAHGMGPLRDLRKRPELHPHRLGARARVHRVEGRRRSIRVVRVHEVEVQEERAPAAATPALEPRDGPPDDLLGAREYLGDRPEGECRQRRVDRRGAMMVETAGLDVLLPEIEPRPETELLGEDRVGGDPGRGVPRLSEDLRHADRVVALPVAVRHQAVARRIETRHKRRRRGPGP
jgi:predicted DNA-binding protein with PD1-like motif